MWECKTCGAKIELADTMVPKFCPACGEKNLSKSEAGECTASAIPAQEIESTGGCTENAPPSYQLAGPWRRWAARLIDYWLLSIIIGFLTAALLLFMELDHLFSDKKAEILIGIWIALLAFLSESIVYAICGDTFGKWLFGVRQIYQLNGRKISAATYFERNLYIYALVFCFGIPVLPLLTFTYQHGRLARHKLASYDERLQVISTKYQANGLKTTFGVIVFIIAILGVTYLKKVS